MEPLWYVYAENGHHFGPAPADHLARAVKNGTLRVDAWVAPPGSSEWRQMQHVPEIVAALDLVAPPITGERDATVIVEGDQFPTYSPPTEPLPSAPSVPAPSSSDPTLIARSDFDDLTRPDVPPGANIDLLDERETVRADFTGPVPLGPTLRSAEGVPFLPHPTPPPAPGTHEPSVIVPPESRVGVPGGAGGTIPFGPGMGPHGYSGVSPDAPRVRTPSAPPAQAYPVGGDVDPRQGQGRDPRARPSRPPSNSPPPHAQGRGSIPPGAQRPQAGRSPSVPPGRSGRPSHANANPNAPNPPKRRSGSKNGAVFAFFLGGLAIGALVVVAILIWAFRDGFLTR